MWLAFGVGVLVALGAAAANGATDAAVAAPSRAAMPTMRAAAATLVLKVLVMVFFLQPHGGVLVGSRSAGAPTPSWWGALITPSTSCSRVCSGDASAASVAAYMPAPEVNACTNWS